jgi:hypothetical protein
MPALGERSRMVQLGGHCSGGQAAVPELRCTPRTVDPTASRHATCGAADQLAAAFEGINERDTALDPDHSDLGRARVIGSLRPAAAMAYRGRRCWSGSGPMASAARVMVRSLAAASSMASGIPSKTRQIRAVAAALSAVTVNAGLAAALDRTADGPRRSREHPGRRGSRGPGRGDRRARPPRR